LHYSGVGLELYLDNSSYFRYSTTDDEIYIATKNFFLGDPNTAFISGSDSNIEISASGFHLTPEGDVTASSFIAVQGGNTLFDSNNEFVDGQNISVE
jgi:meiotically up-regulated gene 157 (Mug157) protein